MAKIKFNQGFEEGLGDFQDLSLKVKAQGTVAVWTDAGTGAKIVLEGKNFEASGEDPDVLGAGKIESAVLTDGDGKLFVAISELNLKAARLMAVYESQGAEGVAFFVTKGDDVVKGSKNAEDIIGGGGDDVLTGGKGSDYFYFHSPNPIAERKAGPEHDVITDFDWKGEDADKLQYLGEYDYKGVHKGADTLITYEDGSTLLLEGVKKGQFEQWTEIIIET